MSGLLLSNGYWEIQVNTIWWANVPCLYLRRLEGWDFIPPTPSFDSGQQHCTDCCGGKLRPDCLWVDDGFNNLEITTHGCNSFQIDSLKKGFDGFDKEGGTINQTTMMMILKSMGVDVNKSDMENYSSEVDEEETGKFTFSMFCQGDCWLHQCWCQILTYLTFNRNIVKNSSRNISCLVINIPHTYLIVAAKFMIEDDEEQMKEELKEAFRIYDKENQGFITNEILKVKINVSKFLSSVTVFARV